MYGMADEFDEVVDADAQELTDGEGELTDGESELTAGESALTYGETYGETALTYGESARELRPEGPPTIAELRVIDGPGTPAVPARQAAALAATGFLAGAAAAALVRRRSTRRPRRSGRLGARRSSEGLPVISTHTYLLRVQVLGHPSD
jgi:hypothetical protein